MHITGYKKTLIIRFLAYFLALFSGTYLVLQLGPLISAETSYRIDSFLGIKHIADEQPVIINSENPEGILPENSPTPSPSPIEGFGALLNFEPETITPISKDYGIVIEKINANSAVIPDVDPADEKQYLQALAKGVAEAKGSTKPGEIGNLFIFSHSTDGPWNITRYNAVFYLLRELEMGDRIIIYYQGKRYNYMVFDKTIAAPDDVSFLVNRYDKPVLTLQTCDPPGTSFKRLIVRAKLLGS